MATGLLEIERFVSETNDKEDEREINDLLCALKGLTVRAQASRSCVAVEVKLRLLR
jgi:hypothetical protein